MPQGSPQHNAERTSESAFLSKWKSGKGLTRQVCEEIPGRSWRRVDQILEKLVIVGILKKAGKRGRAHIFVPVPMFEAILRAPTEPLDRVRGLRSPEGDK